MVKRKYQSQHLRHELRPKRTRVSNTNNLDIISYTYSYSAPLCDFLEQFAGIPKDTLKSGQDSELLADLLFNTIVGIDDVEATSRAATRLRMLSVEERMDKSQFRTVKQVCYPFNNSSN